MKLLSKVRLARFFSDGRRNVFGVACLTEKDGKVLCEQKDFKHIPAPHPCYSASKSTVALAMGFLYDRGLLRPSDKISDYLGEFFPEGIDKRWYDITIDHLLHHKGGFRSQTEFDGVKSDFDFDEGKEVWGKGEYITFFFTLPIDYTPGEVFQYCDINYYLLARIVEKVSGQGVLEFLTENLFIPLGFRNYTWVSDTQRHVLGGTGMMLRTEDFAKLGWLWLHEGVYEGKRYISEEWMKMGLTASVCRVNEGHYGYGVRRLNENGYSITGALGQGLYFNRKKNYVVAWHARGRSQLMTLCEIMDKCNII